MRALSLLYHDVVGHDLDASGFPGGAAARYKLSVGEFARHLSALAQARPDGPVSVAELVSGGKKGETLPFLLTFDDGGSSAVAAAEMLDALGWKGHFLITVGPMGTRGFIKAEDARDLRRRGHTIGSHSFSHPDPMSGCTPEQLRDEWGKSVRILADVLGEDVSVASVPGGAYSRAVATAASSAGIRFLFTSEPITLSRRVEDCLVLGRYTLLRGAPPQIAAALASGRAAPRLRQFIAWNTRKAAKTLGGRHYLRLRNALLARGVGRSS